MENTLKKSVLGEKRFPQYRGKSKDHDEWIYGYFTNPFVPRIVRAGYNEHGSYMEYVDVKLDTVGRETGKNDKNLIDIYEDDVLKYEVEEDGELVTEYLLVYWDKKLAGFLMKSSKTEMPEDMDCVNECEIIGNVHDNPELLKLFEVKNG